MTAASLQQRFEMAVPFAATMPSEPVKIVATPFRWPDQRNLPRRPWVWGRWLLRSTVSAIVAPGGVGKSSFVASMLLSLAGGRQDILGKTVWAGPKRVWYWNLEDGRDELEMQLVAAALLHDADQAACGDRIYLDSGPEGAELCIAVEDRDGFRLATPVVDGLVAELNARKIDVLVVDPFVSSHGVSENDNGAIDAVVKAWTGVAKRASCSIVLVHHTKKLGGEKVTAEAARGAGSLIAAARVALVLNRMDKDEAQKLGIAEDRERRRLFTVQDDKANRAPAEDAQWYRLASQTVDNSAGEDDPFGLEGDSVGVVTRWIPPDPFENVSVAHLRQVQERVTAELHWKDPQSKGWVGEAVATVMGWSADKQAKEDRACIMRLLSAWYASGALVIENAIDPASRKSRPAVKCGLPAVDDVAPPARGGAVSVEQVERPVCSTTTAPIKGAVGGARRAGGAEVERRVEQYPANNPAFRPVLAPGESHDDPVPGWNGGAD